MKKQVIVALLMTAVMGCGGGDNQASPNQLVRVDAEPSGVNCELGGVAISTGSDRDRDEVLDDDEFDSTQYVCNGARDVACRGGSIVEGTVTVSVDAELGQLAGVTCLDGDLIITGTELEQLTSLASLTTVTGAVIIAGNSQLTSLDGLAGLREIGLTYLVQGNAALQDVSAIASVLRAPDVIIVGNDSLVDLEGFGSLNALPFALSITNNASLTSLHGLEQAREATGLRIRANPQLASVAALANITSMSLLEISGNSLLETVTLPNLARIDVRLIVSNNPALTSLRFDTLTTIGDAIHLVTDPALESVEFPSLLSTGIVNVTGATSLTTLSLPTLAFAAANIELSGLPTLTAPDFGKLTQIGGYLLLREIPQLTTLDGFASLSAVNSNMWVINTGVVDFQGLSMFANVGGDLSITGNRHLVGFDGLGAMTEVGGNLVISNNTGLSLSVAQSFASQLSVGGSTSIN